MTLHDLPLDELLRVWHTTGCACHGSEVRRRFAALEAERNEAMQARDEAFVGMAAASVNKDAAEARVAELERVNDVLHELFGKLYAEMARLRKALELIALEDEGFEYDLPEWGIVEIAHSDFRAPAIARAALAEGGQS